MKMVPAELRAFDAVLRASGGLHYGVMAPHCRSDLPNDLHYNKPLPMRWVMASRLFRLLFNYVRLPFNYPGADGLLRELFPMMLSGTAFFIAYMVSNAFSGFVTDKLGTRLGYALCLAFWTTGINTCFRHYTFTIRYLQISFWVEDAGNWLALSADQRMVPRMSVQRRQEIFNSGVAMRAIIVRFLGCFPRGYGMAGSRRSIYWLRSVISGSPSFGSPTSYQDLQRMLHGRLIPPLQLLKRNFRLMQINWRKSTEL